MQYRNSICVLYIMLHCVYIMYVLHCVTVCHVINSCAIVTKNKNISMTHKQGSVCGLYMLFTSKHWLKEWNGLCNKFVYRI